ncbi:hypothetical protein FRX31_002189 [Thalictrum thalictroides]|uniref:Uncharacterized protein n=1 Tax=Thalictrum thalictroides TaxID=46969 RepID=A0A7J6XEQ8_THATH|nr:hypothetical protein FRX31_002189 [Thalictrum thalictroides]
MSEIEKEKITKLDREAILSLNSLHGETLRSVWDTGAHPGLGYLFDPPYAIPTLAPPFSFDSYLYVLHIVFLQLKPNLDKEKDPMAGIMGLMKV